MISRRYLADFSYDLRNHSMLWFLRSYDFSAMQPISYDFSPRNHTILGDLGFYPPPWFLAEKSARNHQCELGLNKWGIKLTKFSYSQNFIILSRVQSILHKREHIYQFHALCLGELVQNILYSFSKRVFIFLNQQFTKNMIFMSEHNHKLICCLSSSV